jgi:general secretion pathway protein F
MRAGEQSGNLGEMLERAADFDEEMARWVDRFVKLFEPPDDGDRRARRIIIVLMMPIFEIASSIQ